MLRWLKSLLSTTSTSGPKVQFEEEYHGYLLAISPQPVNGQYRVAATIYRLDNPDRKYEMVRADLLPDLETANDQTLSKAKLVVDQLGDNMFKD